MAVLLQFSYEDIKNFRWFQKEKWSKVVLFFMGIITLIPWWIFKIIYAPDIRPGLAPSEGGFSWHADAPTLLWRFVTQAPSHSIFWIFVFIMIVLSLKPCMTDKIGRGLVGMFLISLLVLFVVFSGTSLYKFLHDQTTIHRSMLQLYGVATLTATYGIWLRIHFQRNFRKRQKGRNRI